MSVQYINAWQYEPDLAYSDDPDIDGLLRIMLDNNIDFPTTSKGYLGLLKLFIDDRTQNVSEEEQLLHICEYMGVPVPQRQAAAAAASQSSSLARTCSTPDFITADEFDESTDGNASSDASSLKNADDAKVDDFIHVTPTTSTPKKVAHLGVDLFDDEEDDFDKPLVIIEEELDEVEKILVAMNLNEKEKTETSGSTRKRAHDNFSTSPLADTGAAHDSDNDSELSVSEIIDSMSSEPFLPQCKKPRVNTPEKTYRYELASVEKEIAKIAESPKSEPEKDQQEENISVVKESAISETSDIKSVTNPGTVSVEPSDEKESAKTVEVPQSQSDKDQQEDKAPVIQEFVTPEISFTENTVDIVTVKQFTENQTKKNSEAQGSSLPLISESTLKVPQRSVMKFAPTPPPRRCNQFNSSMFSTPTATPDRVESPIEAAAEVLPQPPKAPEKIVEPAETPKRPTLIPAVDTSLKAALPQSKAPEKLNESMETPKRPPTVHNTTTSPGRRPRFTGVAAVERIERQRKQSGSENSNSLKF